jgi:hypothetical protein
MHKMMTALFTLIVTAALAACNTVTEPPASPDLTASANTTAQTGIKGWKITGTSGKDAALTGYGIGGVRRATEVKRNADGSITAQDRFLSVAGAEVFRASFTLKGSVITESAPNTAVPADLCPECMAQDVAAAFPNLKSILENPSGAQARRSLSPAFTGFTFVIDVTCEQARAALDEILRQQEEACNRNESGQRCRNLRGAAIYGGQLVIARCGISIF